MVCAPVAISTKLIGLPDAWIAAFAPSIRGWMFNDPGVAMKPAISPLGTSETMRWPSATPDW